MGKTDHNVGGLACIIGLYQGKLGLVVCLFGLTRRATEDLIFFFETVAIGSCTETVGFRFKLMMNGRFMISLFVGLGCLPSCRE